MQFVDSFGVFVRIVVDVVVGRLVAGAGQRLMMSGQRWRRGFPHSLSRRSYVLTTAILGALSPYVSKTGVRHHRTAGSNPAPSAPPAATTRPRPNPSPSPDDVASMSMLVSGELTRAQSHALAHATPRVRIIVALALASALALAAFAVPSGAAAAAAKATTTQLASIHRLTPAQFAAIERVSVAALPLDSSGRPKRRRNPSSTPQHAGCSAPAAGSPPATHCCACCAPAAATFEFTEATKKLDSCLDAACLKRVLKSTRATLRRSVSASRATDRAINATHLPRRCKQALVTPPKGYAAYRQLDAALGKLERALDTGSPGDLAAAEAALARSEEAGNRLPTSKRSLQLLRSGCR